MLKHLQSSKFLLINWLAFLSLYFITLIIGYIYPHNTNSRKLLSSSVNNIKWIDIFKHNLGLALLIIGAGIVSFAILSFFIVLINLYLLYISFSISFGINDNFLYGIIIISTHGLFEILGLGLAFYLSTISLRKFINNIYSSNKVKVENFASFSKLILFMIIIFLVSSLIEAYITPFIVKHLY